MIPGITLGLSPDDPRMINLTSFARKVEGDFFEMANSRQEYYFLLAQKMHQILKDLAEKQRKRREEQQAEEEEVIDR
jgi:E1A/CREB-binding protein